MKKLLMIPALLAIFLSCGDDIMDAYNERWGGDFTAGDTETYTADGVSFVMAYVPGGKTFPTGMDDLGTPATVDNAYWIGETEVTYELWHKVYTWATNPARGANIYTIAYAGREGNDGTDGAVPTSAKNEPVTYVNWRDSMVWCNALTEWYNAQKGTSYECVYTSSSAIIRDSSNAAACDGAVASSTAKGFRLLTSNEWELAARWRNDATNTVSGYTNPYFTKGNSASGATTYFNDNTAGSGEPGKSANDAVAVYIQYWDGSWVSTGVTSTAVVKSKGLSGANSLGLYDMSGNVWEWCFDLSGSDRVIRGGSWNNSAQTLRVGYWGYYSPDNPHNIIGFRFARTR